MGESAELGLHFGSVGNSTYSCFKAMTGGQSWGEMLEPLRTTTGPFYTFLFYFYIMFSVLVLLNIITGVFVDGAMQKIKYDKDLVIEKEIAAKKASIQSLQEIFSETDTDGSGNISLAEFK